MDGVCRRRNLTNFFFSYFFYLLLFYYGLFVFQNASSSYCYSSF